MNKRRVNAQLALVRNISGQSVADKIVLREACLGRGAVRIGRFNDQEVLVTSIIAFCRVLHRCESLVIRCRDCGRYIFFQKLNPSGRYLIKWFAVLIGFLRPMCVS